MEVRMAAYQPSRNEEFMNNCQRRYFEKKLAHWRSALIEDRNKQKIDHNVSADVLDAATSEADHNIKLASKQRINQLLFRIDQALQKLEDGSYGYCEETGEQIGLERLMAWPIAPLSVESQEKLEKMKKHGKMMVF